MVSVDEPSHRQVIVSPFDYAQGDTRKGAPRGAPFTFRDYFLFLAAFFRASARALAFALASAFSCALVFSTFFTLFFFFARSRRCSFTVFFLTVSFMTLRTGGGVFFGPCTGEDGDERRQPPPPLPLPPPLAVDDPPATWYVAPWEFFRPSCASV